MGYEGRIPALSMHAKSTPTMTAEDQGGRVFFSSTGRSLEGEDEIVVLSVGVDIGSSTSHLVFSRIVLERLDSRYVVSERETFYASDILLTPYSAENTIDADALGAFIRKEYADAKVVDLSAVDVGARLVCLEPDGKITRVEETGRRYGQELGLDLQVGGMLTLEQGRALAGLMADKLFETMRGGAPQAQGKSLLRTEPLSHKGPVTQIQFSGGVSEFIY